MLTGLLIKNIKSLIQTEDISALKICGSEMSHISLLNDAWLFLKDGLIFEFGEMKDLQGSNFIHQNDRFDTIDATGRFVFPSFCDSHTHLVYAGSREIEYIDKIRGLSYEEIARRGGGILNSAKKLHITSEEDLFTQSMTRVAEIVSMGSGAVEIKSGYGLNLEDELKMLRVIRRIKETSPVEVRATFLGAHAFPDEYKNYREKYIDLIINEMIPVIASEDLADFIDVFCDKGFFTVEDTERILMAGIKYGLTARLHANELGYSVAYKPV
jgi:imidazolonepropionase